MNIKIAIVLFISAVLVGLMIMPSYYFLDLRVVSEQGEPIQGVSVPPPAYRPDQNRGLTDSEGRIRVIERTTRGKRHRVEKEGYYASFPYASFNSDIRIEKEVVLREIGNPIPGYFNQVAVRLPEQGVFYGFDLLAGELVEAGDGKIADFEIAVEHESRGAGRSHDVLRVRTPEEHAGFQLAELPSAWRRSEFRSHRTAPEDGYVNGILMERGRPDSSPEPVSEKKRVPSRQPLYFRSRVSLNDEGDIVEAMYCRFFGDHPRIGFNYLAVFTEDYDPGFALTYECNPNMDTADRNMEFDETGNLF